MAERRSIVYPGYRHRSPIPNGSRVGGIVMSGVIKGSDPETCTMPPGLAHQVANVFRHIRLCVEAAGGGVDDIIKVNFWMKQPAEGRAVLNGEWVRMFPDEASRPARHTLALDADSPDLVTCEIIAVIGG